MAADSGDESGPLWKGCPCCSLGFSKGDVIRVYKIQGGFFQDTQYNLWLPVAMVKGLVGQGSGLDYTPGGGDAGYDIWTKSYEMVGLVLFLLGCGARQCIANGKEKKEEALLVALMSSREAL